jgi:putative sigma-54 modulation protein
MQINLTGHHVDITDPLKSYVDTKFDRLARHFDNVIKVHVILSVEKLRQKAEATIHINGANVFADAVHEDMYAAIDGLIDVPHPRMGQGDTVAQPGAAEPLALVQAIEHGIGVQAGVGCGQWLGQGFQQPLLALHIDVDAHALLDDQIGRQHRLQLRGVGWARRKGQAGRTGRPPARRGGRRARLESSNDMAGRGCVGNSMAENAGVGIAAPALQRRCGRRSVAPAAGSGPQSG